MKHHLNYIILHDLKGYHLFERLGKKVPFEAYNPQNSIFSSENLEEVLAKSREVSKSRNQNPENLGKSFPNLWEIEEKPYEVVFNE